MPGRRISSGQSSYGVRYTSPSRVTFTNFSRNVTETKILRRLQYIYDEKVKKQKKIIILQRAGATSRRR